VQLPTYTYIFQPNALFFKNHSLFVIHLCYRYSFAIVGINLTHMAYSLLRDRSLRSHVYNAVEGVPSIHIFHKFYRSVSSKNNSASSTGSTGLGLLPFTSPAASSPSLGQFLSTSSTGSSSITYCPVLPYVRQVRVCPHFLQNSHLWKEIFFLKFVRLWVPM
jgi:hypothetical protein